MSTEYDMYSTYDWIPLFFNEYRFKLWVLGVPDEETLFNILVHPKDENDFAKREEIEDHIIITRPDLAEVYAETIIKGRFEKGEPIILTSYRSMCFYAIRTLKERFPLGEKKLKEGINDNTSWLETYEVFFGVNL